MDERDVSGLLRALAGRLSELLAALAHTGTTSEFVQTVPEALSRVFQPLDESIKALRSFARTRGLHWKSAQAAEELAFSLSALRQRLKSMEAAIGTAELLKQADQLLSPEFAALVTFARADVRAYIVQLTQRADRYQKAFDRSAPASQGPPRGRALPLPEGEISRLLLNMQVGLDDLGSLSPRDLAEYGKLLERRDQLLSALALGDLGELTRERLSVNRFVPVMFATDRAPIGPAYPAIQQFDDRRVEGDLRYGVAEISIPRGHRQGRLERPFKFLSFQLSENAEKHVVVRRAELLDIDSWKSVAAARLDEGERSALVFIHGFNSTFDDAIRRTAQIAWDIQFPGLPVAFSWTSQGRVRDYLADEANAKLAVPKLVDLLASQRA